MNNRETNLKKFSKQMLQSVQTSSSHPLIEVVDGRRVLIEHHCGITEYEADQICVRVRFGTVCIHGADMTLAQISKEQLVITGHIDMLVLKREA